jgi:hypothetical protein
VKGTIRHTFGLKSPHYVKAILGLSRDTIDGDQYVEVCLAPLPPQAGPAVIRAVPIAELIDIHVGAVLVDNVVSGDHRIAPLSIDVQFGHDDRICGRDDMEQFGVARDDVRRPSMFLQTQSPEGRLVYLSMPEIFRFYYFSSSNIARALLSDSFLTPKQYIYAPRHTRWPDKDGLAKLVLRRGINKHDVLTIARILFAEQGIGLDRAREIYAGQIETTQGSVRRLIARPPFFGRTKLTCRGISRATGQSAPLLITRIDTCTAALPFRTLLWRFEDDYQTREWNGQIREPRQPGKPRGQRIGIGSAGFVYLDENEVPTNSFVCQIVEVEQFARRFPSATEIVIHRTKLDAQDDPASRSQALLHADPLNLSARKPSNRGDPAQKTQSVEPSSVHPVDGEANHADDPSTAHRPEVMQHSIALAAEIASIAGAEMSDRVVTRELAEAFSHRFNLFPREVDGKKKRWLYLDRERTVRRPLLIVELSRSSRYGYLIDMYRRGAETMCLMLLRTQLGARASDAQLREVIRHTAAARVRGCQTSTGALSALGLVLVHKPHRLTDLLATRAADYLRILAI